MARIGPFRSKIKPKPKPKPKPGKRSRGVDAWWDGIRRLTAARLELQELLSPVKDPSLSTARVKATQDSERVGPR
ncbi:unnamed protein product [Penicillium pancosmium]